MSQLLDSFPPLPAAQPGIGASGLPNPFGAALAARHVIRPGLGEGRRDFLSFPRGLSMAYSRFRPADDSMGRCDGRDLFKVHFSLAGRNRVYYDGRPQPASREPTLSMSVHPAGLRKSDFHPAGVLEHSVTLACPAAALKESLQVEAEALPAPLRRLTAGREPQLFFIARPLPGRARQLIEEMLSPACDPRVAHLHTEARALDLLCLGLDVLGGERRSDGAGSLSVRDVRALQALRERLGTDLRSPASIAWLAREAGMNRTKLTVGFRSLFGESIGDHLTRVRMRKACQLLKEGLSVAAVATEVGYRHQSSFATAFRAHVGRAPSAVKARSADTLVDEILTNSKEGRTTP